MNPTTATHLHLILSHAPFMAVLFGLALLIIGVSRGSAENQKAALATIVAAAVLTLVSYLTGKPAAGVVKNSPEFVDMILERHQTTAALAVAGCSVLGIVAFAGLLLFQGKGIPAWYGIAILCAGVVVGLVLVWTSNLGGQIRHSEIRNAMLLEKPVGSSGGQSRDGVRRTAGSSSRIDMSLWLLMTIRNDSLTVAV